MTKTKQMENEKWISDGSKAGDVDRRTEVVTPQQPLLL
jgi:hypothetical protein